MLGDMNSRLFNVDDEVAVFAHPNLSINQVHFLGTGKIVRFIIPPKFLEDKVSVYYHYEKIITPVVVLSNADETIYGTEVELIPISLYENVKNSFQTITEITVEELREINKSMETMDINSLKLVYTDLTDIGKDKYRKFFNVPESVNDSDMKDIVLTVL